MTKISCAALGDNSVNATALRAYIERIESLEEEKSSLADDIKGVYNEAKDSGYDKKIIRLVVSRRGKDPDKRKEEEELLNVYLNALEGD